MYTPGNRVEVVLTSTHNLCFEQKYETYQIFLSIYYSFLVVKFSVYSNRRVFVMYCCVWLVLSGIAITLLEKRKLITFRCFLICMLSDVNLFVYSSSWFHWSAMFNDCGSSLTPSILFWYSEASLQRQRLFPKSGNGNELAVVKNS